MARVTHEGHGLAILFAFAAAFVGLAVIWIQ